MACPDHQYSSLMADPNVTNFHFSLEGILLQYNRSSLLLTLFGSAQV